MCDSCLCEAVSFVPSIYIGETPNNLLLAESTEEYNERLYSKKYFEVMVATKDYESISTGDILLVYVNGPSFIFKGKPVVMVDGSYLTPAMMNNSDILDNLPKEFSSPYFDFYDSIVEGINNYTNLTDLARLFKYLEAYHGINTETICEVVDFLANIIIEATKKFSAGEIVPFNYNW